MTMTAAAAVADDGSVRELKRREAELTEQICRLKSKLLLYDETAAERDELRAQLDDVRRWTRELVDDERQLHGELQRDLEAQVSALETAERDRTALDVENRRLADINERIADQLTAVRDNEKRLTVEIDLLEVAKRRALDELECAQVEAERQACEAETARQALERAQVECGAARAQYEERAAECRELAEQRGQLERRLEQAAADLAEVRERAARAEDGWRANEEARACEADEAERRLQDAALEAVEARRAAEQERANACRLERAVAALRLAADRELAEAAARAERLDRENRANEQAARRAEARVSQLRHDSKCAAEEAQRLRDQARVTECLLDEMKRSADGPGCGRLEEAERDKAALKCEVRAADAKIARLEAEIWRLRDRIGGRDGGGSNDGCGGAAATAISKDACVGGASANTVSKDVCVDGAPKMSVTSMCKKLYDEIESLINCDSGGD